ncbi:MBL fold metallo-hydrolase [Methylobrevis albus]|uniref:MBL fold metallo-hydrolase n=1 Tax=Methylobrevis albus TaxID=2793297 RepID=A0A931I4R0_9HYPH|nr:MBL fold metallo-hydrolase [Methylobrevis albus]MBH0239180.1 MBL fold metallo-hydrolase [Methylobrevis albus]
MARHRFTILGCGSSPGVPRIGNDWGACDPNEPKNRRRRASLLIERFADNGDKTVVVIDTGPDFREQMLDAGIGWADGVVYTHAHADHIHGIDDLRAFVLNRRRRVPVYMDAVTSVRLREAFGYCFETPAGSSYPPIVTETRIRAGEAFEVNGPGGSIRLLPFRQIHGDIDSLGFRIGDFAYSSDVSALPDEALPHLEGLKVWIVDALRPAPHPSHLSLSESMAYIANIKPEHAILTHMHIDLDYVETKAKLPPHIEPAYDGLTVDLNVMD